jgi:heat shock protein HslJ
MPGRLVAVFGMVHVCPRERGDVIVRLMVLILTGMLAVSACTTTGDPVALRDREWRLAWVEGFTSVPSGVATPTIRFGSDGRLSGNTACNSAGADYTVERDRLTIGALISTRRACAEPRGNELERAYVAAVESTRRYRITGEGLELLDDGGRIVARFV